MHNKQMFILVGLLLFMVVLLAFGISNGRVFAEAGKVKAPIQIVSGGGGGGGSLVCNGPPVRFESGLPSDWISDANGGPVYWSTTDNLNACDNGGNLTPGSGEAACADADETNPDSDSYYAELISNYFNLSDYDEVTLQFAVDYNDIGDADLFQVWANDGSSWYTELEWNEDHHEVFQLDLSAYAGEPNVLVSFDYSGDGWDWYAQVDDVSLICSGGEPDNGIGKYSELALDWLMDLRDTELATAWADAWLGDPVRPLYRPDIEGVAYYEFPVFNGSLESYINAGYIIVSTGPHDFPIAGWDSQFLPPTWALDEQTYQTIEKYYRLDSSAYVGEALGILVAQLTELPWKLEGQTMSMLDNPEKIDMEWIPDPVASDDMVTDEMSGTIEISGTLDSPVEISDFASWNDLKEEFPESYAVIHEGRRREASDYWELLDAEGDVGIDLPVGTTIAIPIMSVLSPEITFSGEGADPQYMAYSQEEDELFITALAAEPDMGLALEVTIDYGSSLEHTHLYYIVENNERFNYLPLMLFESNATSSVDGEQMGINAVTTGWQYWWAGDFSDQPLYEQYGPYEGPNSNNCHSGCVPTAYAMLIAWADNQAANGNPRWAPRWGLYRANGGTGADAVAPLFHRPFTLTTGIGNVIMNLNGGMDTSCDHLGGTGWTKRKNVIGGLGNYFSGRTGTIGYFSYEKHYQQGDPRLYGFAIEQIRDNDSPAVLHGNNHAQLAWGYAYQDFPEETTYCSARILGICVETTTVYNYRTENWFYTNTGWSSNNPDYPRYRWMRAQDVGAVGWFEP